jgi:hypothetical protein
MKTGFTAIERNDYIKEALNKWIPLVVRQAHHERDQQLTVRPVEGLSSVFP